jgi:hypothetical protein
VADQQPRPCLRTLPPQPRRRVVHNFIGAPNGKSREAAHVTSESGHDPRPSMSVGRPAPASTNMRRLDRRHNKHWPRRNPKQPQCCIRSARGVTRTVLSKCVKCDVALCVDRSCFEHYHTKNDY